MRRNFLPSFDIIPCLVFVNGAVKNEKNKKNKNAKYAYLASKTSHSIAVNQFLVLNPTYSVARELIYRILSKKLIFHASLA